MPWEKGQSGNPKGRPKGARHKLSSAFLQTLSDDFEVNGVEVITRLRTEQPAQYVQTIGKLMPKLMELSGPEGGDVPVSGVVRIMSGPPRKDD